MVRRALIVALLLGLWSCSGGRLLISMERPSTEQLDPMQDPRLAKFGLRVVQAGQTTDQDVFRSNEPELLVGQVPTGVTFDLRVAGKSATDDMLGLGLVLDVAPIEGESEVMVKFRKPIGFVAGGERQLQALNTAGESSSIELEPVTLGGKASHLAATPTGAWLLALVDRTLVPVRTIDHQVRESASLEAPGRCLAVSPDSKNAVVCHESGVSVVPLDLIGSAGVQGRPVDLGPQGRASRVAFASRRLAWVLLDGVDQACSTTSSSAVLIDLGDRDREVRRVELGRPVGDLAVEADGTVLLSLPCETGGARLGRLEGNSVNVAPWQTPGAHDLVLTDRGLVAIGSGTSPVKLQAHIFDRGKGGLGAAPQTRDFGLPPLVVQFTSSGDPQNPVVGFFAWISEARELQIRDVTVAPDGRRAMAVFWARYESNQLFGSCEFKANVAVDGYLLLDLASGTVLLQRYTRLAFKSADASGGCLATCLTGMNTPSDCQRNMRSYLTSAAELLLSPEFEPTSTTLLFGGN